MAAIMADSVETFPSRHTDSFMESCNDWMYYVGRWANRGRSNAQMEKPKIGVSRQFLSEGHKKVISEMRSGKIGLGFSGIL